MNSSATDTLPEIVDLDVDDDQLVVYLADGRTLAAPLSWYPRLEHATAAERSHWALFANGRAVEWPDLDEHIGIDGLIAGRPSQESSDSLARWLEERSK